MIKSWNDIFVALVNLFHIITRSSVFPTPQNVAKSITVTRNEYNPLITPATHISIGDNINGPSIMLVPSWIEKPLGKYYMYFAHHHGNYIRLAYANVLTGPWIIYEPGTLNLRDLKIFKDHIASPDVHVDDKAKEIRMYFHGTTDRGGQKTGVAFSKDGIVFKASDKILGTYYFRVFEWRGHFFSIAKSQNNGGILLYSKDGITSFKKISDIIPRMRHAALLLHDDILAIFYTRIGDAPERILMSTVSLTNDWKDWVASKPMEILKPEMDFEGVEYPLTASKGGAQTHVRALRDPYVFEENAKIYLFYTIAGETGIAVVQITLAFNR
jgi:hypothetical protein